MIPFNTPYLTGKEAHFLYQAVCSGHLFRQNGVDVLWMDYSNYPEYPQLYGPFNHFVSILDLIFNTGPAAADYLQSSR